MTSKIRSLTIDCTNPQRQADFWAAVLGYEVSEVDEEGAVISDSNGQKPRLLFLVVPEGKTVKNRLHFDLTPETSREEEVARLIGLGAKVFREFNGSEGHFTVMQDPEGNEFCVESR
jgi:catechol 2,3-dioxygenase-like lactoylglutathione lyase family enzyme